MYGGQQETLITLLLKRQKDRFNTDRFTELDKYFRNRD